MSDLKQQQEKYITERVLDQYNWYDTKSSFNKKWFYFYRTLVIASGALIPLLVGYADEQTPFFNHIAGALGVVVVIAEGMLSQRKYQENWSIYRMTAERLKREKLLFENGVGDDYAAGDVVAFRNFVVKTEQILASENEEWKALVESLKKQEQNS
ncbi:MAG: DUF4231 domain-containing protein [Lewinellaceae bacterium]|nr:DUF4231 domain-containing protein [Saprospiraceae bacterium]MCB9330249.1 DUF4231 domain-containing protein [Lewinellaceae bacterium]